MVSHNVLHYIGVVKVIMFIFQANNDDKMQTANESQIIVVFETVCLQNMRVGFKRY